MIGRVAKGGLLPCHRDMAGVCARTAGYDRLLCKALAQELKQLPGLQPGLQEQLQAAVLLASTINARS